MVEASGELDLSGYKKCSDLRDFNVSGKEVWLIRAPQKLDLTQIQSLPVDFTGKGKARFENNGVRFEVREDTQDDGSGLSVLVPAGKQTLVSGTSVSRMFTIGETVDLVERAQNRKRSAPEPEVTTNGTNLEESKPAHKKAKKDKADKKDKKDKKEKKEKKEKKHKKHKQ